MPTRRSPVAALAVGVEQPGEIGRMRSKMNGKSWWEPSDAEHPEFSGDCGAQVSQGAITAHSVEHVGASDRGVAMLRRFMREQLHRIAAGEDPAGAVRGEGARLRFVHCANFFAS